MDINPIILLLNQSITQNQSDKLPMKRTPENRFKYAVNLKFLALLTIGLTLCAGIVLSSPTPAFSQSGTTITSGSSGGRTGLARLDSLVTQLRQRLSAVETCQDKGLNYSPGSPLADSDGCAVGNNPCGDSGMLYGPGHPRADANGCVPDFQVSADGSSLVSLLSNHTGGVQLGEPATCDGTTEGTLRYNTTEQNIQLCDGTAWAAISGGGGGGSTEPASWTVFVTSTQYDADLGGLSGADNKCQTAADNAGLSGTYMAWVSRGFSSADISPSNRFPNAGTTQPFTLLTGDLIASHWNDLVDGSIDTTLNIDEFGNDVGGKNVWTNTLTDGTAVDSANGALICGDFTSNSSSHTGMVGRTNETNSRWTQSGSYDCHRVAALYCFQVAD